MRITVLTLFILILPYIGEASSKTEFGDRQLTLDYSIFVGGFDSGRLRLIASANQSTYTLASKIRSEGLIDAIVGFRSRAQTGGEWKQHEIRPKSHSANNLWMGDKRHVKVIYDTNGPTHVEVDPLPMADDREPVPETMLSGTVDALSAALKLSLLASQPDNDRCNGEVRIFDGRRRYNIVGGAIGPGQTKGPVYSGPAYKCRVDLVRIAGHSRNPWSPRQNIEGGEIWYAKLSPNWPNVPVRFESNIGMGFVVIYLTCVDGIDNRLSDSCAKFDEY